MDAPTATPASTPGAAPPAAPHGSVARRPFRWSFLASSSVVLVIVCIGDLLGRLAGDLPGRILAGHRLEQRDWLVLAFLACSAGWAWTSRVEVRRFFRSMYTGASLVGLCVIAVIVGVLVPQMEGFEDPAVRVTRVNHARQYDQFQWAEGYFLYHVLHLYGIGMPPPEVPPGAEQSLDRFGRLYGYEERDNRAKRMRAAFGGSKKTAEIRAQLVGHETEPVVRAVGQVVRDAVYATRAERESLDPASGDFLEHALPAFLERLRVDLRRFRNRYHRELARHWEVERYADGQTYFLPAGERLAILVQELRGRLEGFLEQHAAHLREGDAAARGRLVDAAEERIRDHDYFGMDAGLRRFFQVATALQLNRAFKSAWFATLVGMLGVTIAFNTFTGKPRSWISMRRVGFFVTHMGLLTMFVGGGISKLSTQRGLLRLDTRDGPRDEFLLNFDPAQRTRLPFHVGLERFARKEWVHLEVDFPEEGFKSRPPTYTLWPGRTIDLDYTRDAGGRERPRLRLRVRELHDRARVDLVWREREGPGDEGGFFVGPAARLQLGPERREVVLIPPYERLLLDPAWRFRIAATYDDLDPVALAGSFPREDGAIGVLYVLNESAGAPQPSPIRIRLGQTYTTPSGYSVAVREAVPNYRVSERTGREVRDRRPIAEQYPANPAVWLEITAPEGGESERRLVRQQIDAESVGLQARYLHSELRTWLQWDAWTAPGPARFYLHWGPGREARLVTEAGEVLPVEVGQPLTLGATGSPPGGATTVTPIFFHRQGALEKDIEFLTPVRRRPDEIDADFYSRDPRGMLLDVVHDPDTPQERVETVTMATSDPVSQRWAAMDGRVVLRFFENTAMLPFEWRSVLSIHEQAPDGSLREIDAGSEREREIRVNDYFTWKGYRLFQTDATADLPNYSGIGVVYDPGIPIVLLGMYTIIAGTILAFLVRPIVYAQGKKRKAA